MVEDVGESPFGAQPEALCNREDLAQPGGEVDGARSFHIAYAGGTETANRVGTDADRACIASVNAVRDVVGGAGEIAVVDPGVPPAVVRHAAAKAVGMLRTPGDNA